MHQSFNLQIILFYKLQNDVNVVFVKQICYNDCNLQNKMWNDLYSETLIVTRIYMLIMC